MKRTIIICSLILAAGFFLANPIKVRAAGNAKVITVNLNDSGITDVDLVDKEGLIYPGTTTGTKIKFNVPASKLNGSSLIAFKDGQLVGAIGVVKNNKLRFRISGAPTDKNGEALDKFTVKLSPWTEGTPYGTTNIKGKIFSGKGSVATAEIRNLGINIASSSSLAALSKGKVKTSAISGAAADSDSDSLLDLYDVDKDGDGIIDIADSSIDIESIGTQDVDTEVDLPFTTLYLSMPDTINWHIDGALDSSDVEAVIGGENKFSIAFYFGFATDAPGFEPISGAYAVCPNALEYCRPTSVGASTGVYSGFSEGDSSLLGQNWSSLTASGQEYSLENLPANGGGDVWAAAIQPRVGTDKFRPGDSYRVDFLNESNEVIKRKALTLPPYFITVPALRAYNITDNDSDNDVLVDYSDSSDPGMSMGSPIVLASAGGFSGKLRVQVWRLQRAAVSGLESGDYRDFGHLNYGVLINNNSGEFTCGELYEDLSSTLTELPSQGQGGSYQSNAGALLWPLVDSADDYEPSSASDTTTIGDNTISFTVDLASCLDRNGLNPGTHQITITAAGVDTGHGNNRAAQTLYVTIP